jgi:hypothetical protein
MACSRRWLGSWRRHQDLVSAGPPVWQQGSSRDPLSADCRPEVRRSIGPPGTQELAAGHATRTQGPSSCEQGTIGSPGPERRAREVVDMVIALWIVAIVTCCTLCVWGIATTARRKGRRAQASTH